MGKKNFEIDEGGRIVFKGEVLNPGGLIRPRRPEKRVELPVEPKLPKPRWRNGSYLTSDQAADECFQREIEIA